MLGSGKSYSWILLIAMLTLPFSNALAKQAKDQDCQLQRYASIDLSVNKSGLVLVPVSINGHKVQMALHLAASLGMLSPDALEYLGLDNRRLGDDAMVKIGKKTIGQYLRAPDFVIADQAKYGAVEFMVVKDLRFEPAEPDSPPVVGYLGFNNFKNVDIELDLSAAKLNLYAPSNCPDQVVYWAHEYAKIPIIESKMGELFFVMELNGKELQTVFSTIDKTTVLYTDASRKLYDFDETSPDTMRESGVGTGDKTSYYRAMAVTNKGMKILNAKIALLPGPVCGKLSSRANGKAGVGYDGCYGAYPLRLGLNVLRKLHIYIATKEKALYFTHSDAGQAEASP